MKPKVLIAEDNKDLHFIYDKWIGDDYEIITACNGEEAVNKYLEHKPDITLMDIKMPGMTGDIATNHILAHDPEAKIIAVTAYDYSEEELSVPIFRKMFRKKDFLEMIKEGLYGKIETMNPP